MGGMPLPLDIRSFRCQSLRAVSRYYQSLKAVSKYFQSLEAVSKHDVLITRTRNADTDCRQAFRGVAVSCRVTRIVLILPSNLC